MLFSQKPPPERFRVYNRKPGLKYPHVSSHGLIHDLSQLKHAKEAIGVLLRDLSLLIPGIVADTDSAGHLDAFTHHITCINPDHVSSPYQLPDQRQQRIHVTICRAHKNKDRWRQLLTRYHRRAQLRRSSSRSFHGNLQTIQGAQILKGRKDAFISKRSDPQMEASVIFQHAEIIRSGNAGKDEMLPVIDVPAGRPEIGKHERIGFRRSCPCAAHREQSVHRPYIFFQKTNPASGLPDVLMIFDISAKHDRLLSKAPVLPLRGVKIDHH